MSNLTKIVESEIENLSEKDRKLLKDKLKKQEESFTNKVSEIIGEEYDKLEEGRPIPMATPDELAYKDFKKWAHSKRSKMKKQMQSLKGDATKIFRAMGLVWQTWAKATDNKEFARLKDPNKFGRALVVMMVKDNLVFDKKAWGKNNKIINIKEGNNKSDVNYAMKLAFDNTPGNWTKALKRVEVVGDKIKLNMSSYMGPGKTLDAIVDEFNNAMGMKGYTTGPKPFKVDKSSYKKGSITSVMLFQEGKLTEIKKGDYIIDAWDEIGLVNKVKGKVAYVGFESNPKSFQPVEVAALKKKSQKYKGKDLYIAEGKLTESMIGIKTKANFKPLQLKGALEKAKIKGFQMNRLSVTLTALKLDKKYFNDAKKIIDNLGLSIMMAKESVNEDNINEDDYKYKKYVSKAFKKLNDAMFDFRHAMGIKQLGQADSKLKNKVDGLHQAVFNLQKEMKADGLTEGILTEMDINDPILVAVRARATMLKKAKAAPKVKKISMNQYYKLMDKEIDLITKMKDAAKEFDQMNSDMLQDAGQKMETWTDKDANKWGGGLDKLQTKIETLAKQKLVVKKAIMDYRIN